MILMARESPFPVEPAHEQPLPLDECDIYLHYDLRTSLLPPTNNTSPWMTFASQYPDHIFNLRKFLRERYFDKTIIAQVPKLAFLQMDGVFNYQGATLSICPVWILSPSDLKRKLPSNKIKISMNKPKCLYRLLRTQLERYLDWIEKQPRQAKRLHTIREIDCIPTVKSIAYHP